MARQIVFYSFSWVANYQMLRTPAVRHSTFLSLTFLTTLHLLKLLLLHKAFSVTSHHVSNNCFFSWIVSSVSFKVFFRHNWLVKAKKDIKYTSIWPLKITSTGCQSYQTSFFFFPFLLLNIKHECLLYKEKMNLLNIKNLKNFRWMKKSLVGFAPCCMSNFILEIGKGKACRS